MLQQSTHYKLLLFRCFKLSTRSARFASHESRDVFGALSESGSRDLKIRALEKHLPEDPDGYDEESFDLAPRKNAYYYKYEINKQARTGKPLGLRKALEMYHQLKQDRLKPDFHTITPLIYGCARAGYTLKAFELYQEYLIHAGKPSNSVITCLINACAECPYPDYGLNRLKWLRDHMKFGLGDKHFNLIQYNSLVKAYGRLGQLDEAGRVVQEMIDSNINPDAKTFNMLMMGCLSNKEAGTTLALKVYKTMKQYGFKPGIDTYNLLLKCIACCQMGSNEFLNEAIGSLSIMTSPSQRLGYKAITRKQRNPHVWLLPIPHLKATILDILDTKSSENQIALEPVKNDLSAKLTKDNENICENLPAQLELNQKQNVYPNLLSDDHLTLSYQIQSINVNQANTKSRRLELFGGVHGYFDRMLKDKCQPDKKTLNLLLDIVKSPDLILEIHRTAKENSIDLDPFYYNYAIKRTCMYFSSPKRLERALFLLNEMQKDSFRPDINTFEALALGCNSFEQASKLLSDIENCGFRVSNEMLNNMFKVAKSQRDFEYLSKLIKISKRYQFMPKDLLVEDLETIRLEFREEIINHEKGKLSAPLSQAQIKSFDKFSEKLDKWLRSVQLEPTGHPWAHYDRIPTGTKRDGFMDFVHRFKALEQAKQEAIEGHKKFGNLAERSEEIYDSKKRKLEISQLSSPKSKAIDVML